MRGYVQEILPRKNFLVRPPLANLDKLFVVSSVCDPQPSTLIIDKTIAAAELRGHRACARVHKRPT